MNVIYYILLCLIIFAKENNSHNEKLSLVLNKIIQIFTEFDEFISLPVRQVKMIIDDDSGSLINMNLTQSQRSLANENLPVWKLKQVVAGYLQYEMDNYVLERNNDVMIRIGDFTIYQDPQTSSAAIYFHKRREFDGMINTRYLIQKLSVESIYSELISKLELNKTDINRQGIYNNHLNDYKGFIVEDPDAGINYQQYRKTFNGQLYDGYPEVLVVVSWGMTEELTRDEPQSNRDVAIVSYVLTLFNGVDMLFSKLEATKIQINIAGVIIPAQPRSLAFLDKCFLVTTISNNITEGKQAGCLNKQIREFVLAHKDDIPIESYDVVIFLTKEKLLSIYTIGDKTSVSGVLGQSTCIHKLFEHRKKGLPMTLVASIQNVNKISDYPSITHEIAHLLTVEHDKLPYFTYNGDCCGNLMKSRPGWCEKCISWSETSEKTFFALFSSPNCCTFINKPRSLLPPGQHEMLTADTQCQCYGYQSSLNPSEISKDFCSERLQCLNLFYKYIAIAVPMDGTPCEHRKVCWQMHCKDVTVALPILSLIWN